MTTTPTTYWIVPCGAAKLTTPAPARALYTSPNFAKALRCAERCAADEGGEVLIMSALHGLVRPDDVLAPYDAKMGTPGSITVDQLAASPLVAQIAASDAEVFCLLPHAYFDVLDAALRLHYVFAADVYEAAPGIGYQRGTTTNIDEFYALTSGDVAVVETAAATAHGEAVQARRAHGERSPEYLVAAARFHAVEEILCSRVGKHARS